LVGFLWACTSLIWSDNTNVGIIELTHLGLGLYLIVYINFIKINDDMIYKIILIVFSLNLLISVGEGFQLFHYPISKFASLLNQETSDRSMSFFSPSTGFHWNPNNNAFFILIIFPLFLGRKEIPHWLVCLFFILSSLVIYFTGSRIIQFGWWVVVFPSMFYYLFKPKLKKMLLIYFSFLLLIAFLFITLNFEKISSLKTKICGTPQGCSEIEIYNTDSSLGERFIYLVGTMDIIGANPILGLGAGGLENLETRNQYKHLSLSLKSPHFYFAEVAAKYGVLFLAFYTYLLIYLATSLWKNKKIASFVSLSLIVLFNPALSSISYFIPYWFCLSIFLKEIIWIKI
jgi:hypothetical protein